MLPPQLLPPPPRVSFGFGRAPRTLERIDRGKLNARLCSALVVCGIAARNQLGVWSHLLHDRGRCNPQGFFAEERGTIFLHLALLRQSHDPPGKRMFLTATRNPRPQSPLFVPVMRLPSAACYARVSLYSEHNLLRTALWGASERPRPQTWVCA